MAIYHLDVKPISRAKGRSSVAAAAYRAGDRLTDERTGKTHNYKPRKNNASIIGSEIIIPNAINATVSRQQLWNMAESAEKRSNSRTAREVVIAIPNELMTQNYNQGINAVKDFAKQLAEQYNVIADYAIHAPDKKGDNRNYHAHIMLTTRQAVIGANGEIALGEKSQLELSNTQLEKAGLPRAQDEIKNIRERWANIANHHLEAAGINERIDHRSHAERGLEALPTVKMGYVATQLERNGIETDVGNINRQIKAHNEALGKIKTLQSNIGQLMRQQAALQATQAPQTATQHPQATQAPQTAPQAPQATRQPQAHAAPPTYRATDSTSPQPHHAPQDRAGSKVESQREKHATPPPSRHPTTAQPPKQVSQYQMLVQFVRLVTNRAAELVALLAQEPQKSAINQIRAEQPQIAQVWDSASDKQQNQAIDNYPIIKQIENKLPNVTRYPLTQQDLISLTAFVRRLEQQPQEMQQTALSAINDKIPNIASGKIKLPPAPDNRLTAEQQTQPTAEQTKRNRSSPER